MKRSTAILLTLLGMAIGACIGCQQAPQARTGLHYMTPAQAHALYAQAGDKVYVLRSDGVGWWLVSRSGSTIPLPDASRAVMGKVRLAPPAQASRKTAESPTWAYKSGRPYYGEPSLQEIAMGDVVRRTADTRSDGQSQYVTRDGQPYYGKPSIEEVAQGAVRLRH